jgi:ketosteroid isomerase-like protein
MRSLVLAIALCVLLGGGTAPAQQGSQADHEALRKLKTDVVNAINARKLDGIDVLLHRPFMTTVITQDSFIDAAKLKAYFEGLFTRRFLRIANLQMEAEADETAQIYTGTFAVARGSTKERYDMADGNSFTIDGRWTATALKDNEQWKVLALHSGTNFLDNPVLSAIERSTLYVASGAGAAGIVLGFLAGFFVRRRRAKPA